MTERVRKPKPAPQTKAATEAPVPSEQADAEKLKAETDALLDAIDEVLADVLGGDLTDELAQEFVTGFRQKGGE